MLHTNIFLSAYISKRARLFLLLIEFFLLASFFTECAENPTCGNTPLLGCSFNWCRGKRNRNLKKLSKTSFILNNNYGLKPQQVNIAEIGMTV